MTEEAKKEPQVASATTEEVANEPSAQTGSFATPPEPEITTPVSSALAEAICALQAEQKKTYDRLLRTAADLENFKRRSRQELTEKMKRAEEKVVLDFLPVVDNLERALAASETAELTSFADGVKMVYRQFLAAFDRYEIAQQEALGQQFDPALHEALQQMSSEYPPGTICQVLQKGYRRADRIVRPALVIVSTGPAVAQPETTVETTAQPAESKTAAAETTNSNQAAAAPEPKQEATATSSTENSSEAERK